MEIQHKGWDWDAVKSESWNEISEEFLPVALSWVRKYHSVLDIGTGKGRHAFFFAKNGFKASAIDLSESSITYVKEQIKEKGLDNIDARVEDMTEFWAAFGALRARRPRLRCNPARRPGRLSCRAE